MKMKILLHLHFQVTETFDKDVHPQLRVLQNNNFYDRIRREVNNQRNFDFCKNICNER